MNHSCSLFTQLRFLSDVMATLLKKNASDIKSVTVSGAFRRSDWNIFSLPFRVWSPAWTRGRHTLEDNTTKEAIRKKGRKRLKELNCTRDVPNISESEKPSYSLVSI